MPTHTLYIAPGLNQCRIYDIPYPLRVGQKPSDLAPRFQDNWKEIGMLDHRLKMRYLDPAYAKLQDVMEGMMGGTFFTAELDQPLDKDLLERMWSEFETIPRDTEGCIKEAWTQLFRAGTPAILVEDWFDHQNPAFVRPGAPAVSTDEADALVLASQGMTSTTNHEPA